MGGIEELQAIIRQVGEDTVWRPILDHRQNLLATGIGVEEDGLPSDLDGVVLKNKAVVDLGCNFGHYTFWASDQGADHVLGIDIDPVIISGCRILQDLRGYHNVAFEAGDITTLKDAGPFDMAMMIDFIGKESVRTGLLTAFLDALERLAGKEMLVTIRPYYRISKHLENDRSGLLEKYPSRYIEKNTFLAHEYIRERFEDAWHMTMVSVRQDPEGTSKETLHFTRKEEVVP